MNNDIDIDIEGIEHNYYGGLNIRRHNGLCSWGIEGSCNEIEWTPISENLYNELLEHHHNALREMIR